MARVWIRDRWNGNTTGPGSRWEVGWYETTIDPDTGQPKRRRRTKQFRKRVGKDTTRHADAFRAAKETELTSGSVTATEDREQPFHEAAQRWLASRHRIKGSTRHGYERDLKNYVLPQFGHRRLDTIRRADIERWVRDLRDGTAPTGYQSRRPGPQAASSVRRLHTLLTGVLGYAVRQEWLQSNPASGIELPRPEKDEPVFLSPDEVESLADGAEAVGGYTDRILIWTLAYTGARLGEALALRISDIDRDRPRATIRATLTVDQNGQATRGSPKTGKPRTVPVPQFLHRELLNLTRDRPSSDPVFTSPRGHEVNPHNWRNRIFNTAVQAAGLDIPGLTPHKLRHTAASLAIASGADVLLVAEMLGHEDARETLRTYSHLWPDRLDTVAAAMSAARDAAITGGDHMETKPL